MSFLFTDRHTVQSSPQSRLAEKSLDASMLLQYKRCERMSCVHNFSSIIDALTFIQNIKSINDAYANVFCLMFVLSLGYTAYEQPQLCCNGNDSHPDNLNMFQL